MNIARAATALVPVVGIAVALFKEIVPSLRRMLVLTDPDDPGVPEFRREVRQVAAALKVTTIERSAGSQGELRQGFASVSRSNTDGIFIASLNLRVKFHALILQRAGTLNVNDSCSPRDVV